LTKESSSRRGALLEVALQAAQNPYGKDRYAGEWLLRQGLSPSS
jgi:hypothetical protein